MGRGAIFPYLELVIYLNAVEAGTWYQRSQNLLESVVLPK